MNTYNFTRGKFLRVFNPEYNYSTNRASGKIIFLIIVGFLYMFLCVWFSTQAIKYNYNSNELTVERDKLRIANRALEIKLQSMMSSEQIAKIAKERYGFKNPTDSQIVIIKKENSILKIIADKLKGAVL